MNNVTIMGRLGSEPVVRNTNGSTVARLSLGVTTNSEKNSDKSTEWIDVYLRDSLALIAQQYYHTGDKIYIYGHLVTGSMKDRDGNVRYATQIIADESSKVKTARRNLNADESEE